MLPPPVPTLFPYTTLFRSRDHPPRSLHLLPLCYQGCPTRKSRRLPGGFLHWWSCRSERCDPGSTANELLDRKSTRLNSSHLGISYAVFCLKKKTLNEEMQC